MARIVDLSHVITPGKAGRKFALEMVGAETVNPNVVRLEGQWYIMHNINMVSHIGTHIEAPYHLFKSKADLAGIPLERLMGEAVLLDLRHCPRKSAITLHHVQDASAKVGSIRPGDIVFCNLGSAAFYGMEEYGTSPYFSPEAIRWLVDQGMKLMGVDASGVEVPGSEDHVNHSALLSGVYHGIGMPVGAPKEVRNFLVEALKRVITSDPFTQRMEKMSYEPVYMDPAQYSAFWSEYESGAKKWVEMAK